MFFSTHFLRKKKTTMTMAAKATIPPAAYSIGKLNSGFKKSYLAEIIQTIGETKCQTEDMLKHQIS